VAIDTGVLLRGGYTVIRIGFQPARSIGLTLLLHCRSNELADVININFLVLFVQDFRRFLHVILWSCERLLFDRGCEVDPAGRDCFSDDSISLRLCVGHFHLPLFSHTLDLLECCGDFAILSFEAIHEMRSFFPLIQYSSCGIGELLGCGQHLLSSGL
jgi:hypothetical protein